MVSFNESNELTKKFDTKFLKILIYGLILLLLIGINSTYVFNLNLTPFGISIVFALFYIGFNGYILGCEYMLTAIIANMSIVGFLQGINVLIVLSIVQYLININKKIIKKWIMYLLVLISMLAYIISFYGLPKENLALLISIILSEIFLYLCICFFDGLKIKGYINKLTIDEKTCGFIVLLLFYIGISQSYVYTFNLGLILASILVLFANCMLSSGALLLVSGVIGLGFAIGSGNYMYVSLFIINSFFIIPFKDCNKIFAVIAYILGYLIISVIDSSFCSVWNYLCVFVGGLIYYLLSKSVKNLTLLLYNDNSYVYKDIYNRKMDLVTGRISRLSLIFAEMCDVYKDMVKGNLTNDDVSQIIKESLISDVCKGCDNYNNCYRLSNSLIEDAVEYVVKIGIEKDKVCLVDVPEYMSINCCNLSLVISTINNLLNAYNQYCESVNNLDSSRLLIASQLDGVSKLLSTLSCNVCDNGRFDGKMADLIKENMAYYGVICADCFVVNYGFNVTYININVNNININDKNIENIIYKILKRKYVVVSKNQSSYYGCSNVVLINAPKYNIVFGSSIKRKDGSAVSGDNHSIIEIDNGKYMLSICDGMGSGNRADKMSALTLKLIEHFYRAGFDNDIILSSVNKLLSIDDSESFSSIDTCIIDGRNNTCDFIKLGATNGYILHNDKSVETIVASGLPVGVIENIRPHTIKRSISSLDMIILMSDGVADVLGNNVENYIKSIDNINPQTFSDNLLDVAVNLSGGVAGDDMTIICARIIDNV